MMLSNILCFLVGLICGATVMAMCAVGRKDDAE